MFAMRYKPDHCGGHSLDSFIGLVQAEGAPIYRAFAAPCPTSRLCNS